MFIRYFDPRSEGPGDYLEGLGLLVERSENPDDLKAWFEMLRWDSTIVLACSCPLDVELPVEGGAIVLLGAAPSVLPEGVLHLPKDAPRQMVLETVLVCRQRAARKPPPSALLRGLAHAISNPVASALGWAQLLSGRDDTAIDGVVKELKRVDQLARALAVIGLRPSLGRSPLRFMQSLEPALDRAEKSGLVIHRHGSLSGVVLADAGELQLLFDLLFAALVEERKKIPSVEVSCRELGATMEIRIDAKGAAFPAHRAPDDLCGLLEEGRRTKALAMAAAHAVVVKRLGGRLEITPDSVIIQAPCRDASAVDLQSGSY